MLNVIINKSLSITLKSKAKVKMLVVPDSLQPHGLQPSRLLCPWNSPGKNTGVGSHSLLQRIFPTQGWKLGLPHCRQVLYHLSNQFSSVQLLSRVQLFATPWIAARQASLSITNSQSLPKLMSIESVMPSSHLILCHPLLLLPQIPPSIRVFSNESTLYEVAKVLEFQLQHQSFQWTPRTDLL